MAVNPLWKALSNGPIGWFILGTFCSNVGTWAQRLTIGWLVFDYTASAAWVGAVAACEAVPAFLVGPFAGSLADRLSRARMLVFGQTAAMIQAAVLVGLAAAALLSVEVFVVAAAILGIIDGFNQPTRLSLISNIASSQFRATAVALNSFSFNAARFLGPVVGGAALASAGPMAAFGLNAGSFVPLIVFLLVSLRRGLLPSAQAPSRGHDGIRGGIRYAIAHAVIGPLFFMLLVVSLLARPIIELLPAISGVWLDGAPGTLAHLTSSVGIGAMAGGLCLAHIYGVRALLGIAVWLPGCLLLGNCAIALAGGAEWALYPLLVLAGAFVVSYGIATQGVIHMIVAPDYLGRVLALYGLLQRAVTAIGAFLIGGMIDIIGLRGALISSAALAGLGWAGIWRHRNRLEQHASAGSPEDLQAARPGR